MNSQPKLEEVLREYLQAEGAELADNTVTLLQYAWKHLMAVVGNIPVDQFTTDKAEDFAAYLVRNRYSPTTRRMWIGKLRPITQHAQRKGYVNFNAWANVKLPRQVKNKVRVFSPKQIKAILAAAPDARRRFIVMVCCAGLRPGEALNLRRQDIDVQKHCIYIQPHEAAPRQWPWTAKDLDYRVVPLYDAAEACYQELLLTIPCSQSYVCLSERLYLELLLRWRTGKLTGRYRSCPEIGYAKWVRQMFGRALYEDESGNLVRGIEGTLYNLRDTAATNWLNSGMPMHEVSALLGHTSVETTQNHYYEPNLQKIAGVAQTLAPWDWPNPMQAR